MEELKSAMNAHLDQMSYLTEKITAELRSGSPRRSPAIDYFIGFFHAIDWKEPWLIGLISFHVSLLLIFIISRKNVNFQMGLFLVALAGVYLVERMNASLRSNWENFAGQNYFDPRGVFVSVLWSGPLLCLATVILINTLVSLCQLIVKWEKTEVRYSAQTSENNKQD